MDADAVEDAPGAYLAHCSLLRSLQREQASEESIDIPGSVDSAPGGLWSLSQEHLTGAQHLQRHGNDIWHIGAYSYPCLLYTSKGTRVMEVTRMGGSGSGPGAAQNTAQAAPAAPAAAKMCIRDSL